jgi:nitrogen fixation protein NifX
MSPASAPPISREVALRIGLAARKLPTISVGDLIEALRDRLGDVLDESALTRITVTDLKSAFRQSQDVDGDEDREDFRTADMPSFKEAVRILWGEVPDGAGLPRCQPLADGEMPVSLRVAVASNDGEHLDGHFGSCARFLIYQVSADEIRLVDVRPALEADLSPDKNTFRVGLIRDCRVLHVVSVGGPAAAKVIKADIHILPVPEGGPAREILARLQPVIAGSPPPWLAKALRAAPAERHQQQGAKE